MLKLTIIGNLGSDPEMRYSANGSPFLRFNVASSYRVRSPEGEWQDRTEWVRVTVFGQRADTLNQHLRKGMRVYVDGRLEARPWTDRSGNVQAGLEVLANEVQFMGARPSEDAEEPARVSTADEHPARQMPQDVAVHGARGGTAVAARDDSSELEGLPF
jgi:single-strand DNA-binding protein